jgi:hypothetical protein
MFINKKLIMKKIFDPINLATLTGQQLGNMLKELLSVFNVQPFSANFPNSFNGNVAKRTLLLTNNSQQGFEVIISPSQADYREPYDYPFEVKLYGIVGYSLRFDFDEVYHKPNFTQSRMTFELEGKDEGFEKICTDMIAVFSKYSMNFK